MRFGTKRVIYFSGFLMAFALLAISLMVNLWLTAAMLMIFGACTISIDVAANVNGVAVERHTRKTSHVRLPWRIFTWHIDWSRVDECAVLNWNRAEMGSRYMYGSDYRRYDCRMRDLLPKDGLRESSQKIAVKKDRKIHIPPMVIVIGLLCFIMYASEGAVMGWSAIFVSEERGVDISAAGFSIRLLQ